MKSSKYNIEELFNECIKAKFSMQENVRKAASKVIEFSEKQKGVLTVIITGCVYKCFHPEQDVRYHQSNMEEGYSGRSFDTKYITPFLRKKEFPSMAESGWLTRSLEQNVPYKKNYLGKISGNELKESFLFLYDFIEQKGNAFLILSYLFQELVKKRDKSKINLSIPSNLTVSETLNLIKHHIHTIMGKV